MGEIYLVSFTTINQSITIYFLNFCVSKTLMLDKEKQRHTNACARKRLKVTN